jgi:hypothetical protein
MTYSLFLALGKVTPEVFLKMYLLGPQEGISDAHQAHVMVSAQTMSALEVIEPQLFLQFPVIQSHPPASLAQPDQTPQPDGLRTQLRQPVLGRVLRTLGLFHQHDSATRGGCSCFRQP